MDPDITLELIRQALNAGNGEAAREAAEDLRDWTGRGGFPPADPMWRDTMREALA